MPVPLRLLLLLAPPWQFFSSNLLNQWNWQKDTLCCSSCLICCLVIQQYCILYSASDHPPLSGLALANNWVGGRLFWDIMFLWFLWIFDFLLSLLFLMPTFVVLRVYTVPWIRQCLVLWIRLISLVESPSILWIRIILWWVVQNTLPQKFCLWHLQLEFLLRSYSCVWPTLQGPWSLLDRN